MEQIENPVDHHRAKIIGTIAIVHFLLTVSLFFVVTGNSMAQFDGRGLSSFPTLLLNGAFHVLSFPLLTGFLLLKIANTGIWGWLPFVANSLLWGWAGWRVVRFRRS